MDSDKILRILDEEGPLARNHKGFEVRSQQRTMMANVIEAYNQDQIALIEAGTGTGKSIAYLIPAIIWATSSGEKTVISTNTINLQEQLIEKDIPRLLKTLNISLKAVLVKGMGNYICLRKLDEAQMELRLFPTEELEEIEKISSWSRTTKDGTRADLMFKPSGSTWEKVCAESETCSHNQCPYFDQCHFFNARKNAQDAQLLVVNHRLLLADLVKRADLNNYDDSCILPSYKRIILDEAHHLEDLATEHFATRLHRLELNHLVGRLASEKQGLQQGKLPLLKSKIQSFYNKIPPKEFLHLIDLLNIEFPALRHRLNDSTNEAFDSLAEFVETIKFPLENIDRENPEKKLRLLKEHQLNPYWQDQVVPKMSLLIETLTDYCNKITEIEGTFKRIDNEKLHESTKSTRTDIQGLAHRLTIAIGVLSHFISEIEGKTKVRWIETQKMRTLNNVHLVDADLNIARDLVNKLFEKYPTIILCSATLTSNKNFDFIRRRLGLQTAYLESRTITENVYDSPFNYQKQALLVVPTDMPLPSHPDFNPLAFEAIFNAIKASQGQAFVLFTSYTMMKQCALYLGERLAAQRFPLFRHGEDNRQTLLNKFKSTSRAVLFGTDSFWEGVDVSGEALRCVIIVKLPFKVPSEPIIQARTEAILENGGEPFTEYAIPQAVVKFKQGFGRLIRHKSDRGCIVCLDKRVVVKNYGAFFLNSLPACEYVFMNGNLAWEKMTQFYRKTYFLTKQH